MRILLSSNHHYPSFKKQGSAKEITEFPSGSSHHQHDLLARGLAEKGHTVFYHVNFEESTTSDPGVILVKEPVEDVDIVHVSAIINRFLCNHYRGTGIPVIATNHLYHPECDAEFTKIHVSKSIADLYNDEHHVWCGLDPNDYIYRKEKAGFILFMADMSRYEGKGLQTALSLCKKANKRLIVAGSSRDLADIRKVERMCDAYGAMYVGDVRGEQKAKLLAGANAFLSPSNYIETFGITLVEALFSGTPVICSNKGAYGEVISKDVGFVCNSEADYLEALEYCDRINPEICRTYALNHFHYKKTAENYEKIYTEILEKREQESSINY